MMQRIYTERKKIFTWTCSLAGLYHMWSSVKKKNGETKYSKTIHTNKGYRNTYTAQESKILWHDIIIYKS